MNDFRSKYPNRKFREVWAVLDDFTVKQVQAFACSDDDAGFWFSPETGFSACIGYSLQPTKESAISYANNARAKRIDSLERELARLKDQQATAFSVKS